MHELRYSNSKLQIHHAGGQRFHDVVKIFIRLCQIREVSQIIHRTSRIETSDRAPPQNRGLEVVCIVKPLNTKMQKLRCGLEP